MTLKEQDPKLHQELINRMRRIEGQVRGVQRLLNEGAECDEVVMQIAAVRAALSRVGLRLLSCQLGLQVADEVRQGGTGKAATDEWMTTFMRLQ